MAHLRGTTTRVRRAAFQKRGEFLQMQDAERKVNEALPVEVLESFGGAVDAAETLCFITRDSSLQIEALGKVERALVDIALHKSRFASCSNEDSANACLALECMLRALGFELAMWLAIKEGNHDVAWDYLIGAQNSASAAARAHPCGANGLKRLPLYAAIEELIFPPQVFMSTGGVVKRQICSICDQAYGDCDHISGRPYAGRFCQIVVTEIDLAEVSFVECPKDKRCRVLEFSEGTGWRNKMTWTLRSEGESSSGADGLEEQVVKDGRGRQFKIRGYAARF